MQHTNILKKVVFYSLLGASLAVNQSIFAHTRLQVSTVDENSAQHGSDYNNEVIGHGCQNPTTGTKDINTLGTVVVFPDGVDSTISSNGAPHEGSLTDFVQNWGSPVAKIQNKDVFDIEDEIKDPLGNVVGYWAGGGHTLKGGLTGLIPFRTTGVIIEPTSCAKTVKFIVAIADICKITPISGFADDNVMLWTPAVGSNFDGGEALNGYDSPASLTVNRTSDLAAECGEGLEVVVTPSAAQLNRDMPVVIDGTQIWPQP